MPTDLLSTKQVAELLKLDVRTVHRWAESGRLPVAHRLPGDTGAYLFQRADVDALAAASSGAASQ